jgi:5'-deoxy-5'-methylthioadenosine phosphorylase
MNIDQHPPLVAVIGGTGMNAWPGLEIERRADVMTPYGAPSAPLLFGRIHGIGACFMARHGEGHKIPPHKINYRANLWALRDAGIRDIVAIAAVGGITHWYPPAAVGVPDDAIDYSFGREHTYSDGGDQWELHHVEMNDPYSPRLRHHLIAAARAANVEIAERGVMGVTQGPRLETPAEIRRLQHDGCDIVGMTSFPEAPLARELGLHYACLAVSVNWGAGIGNGGIHDEIAQSVEQGMAKVRMILSHALPAIASEAG